MLVLSISSDTPAEVHFLDNDRDKDNNFERLCLSYVLLCFGDDGNDFDDDVDGGSDNVNDADGFSGDENDVDGGSDDDDDDCGGGCADGCCCCLSDVCDFGLFLDDLSVAPELSAMMSLARGGTQDADELRRLTPRQQVRRIRLATESDRPSFERRLS